VPYRRIAALTAGDVALIDGVATIKTTIGLVTVHPEEDPVVCGPYALVRWLRALHFALTSPATRTRAGAIDRAAPVDGASPHLCRSRRPIAQGIGDVPLLPPIDPRGYLAIAPRPLSPHSVSHLARGNTTGPGAVHRVEPQTADEPQLPPPPATPVVPPPTPYGCRLGTGRRPAPRRPGVSPRCRPRPGRDGSEGRRPEPQNPGAARRPVEMPDRWSPHRPFDTEAPKPIDRPSTLADPSLRMFRWIHVAPNGGTPTILILLAIRVATSSG